GLLGRALGVADALPGHRVGLRVLAQALVRRDEPTDAAALGAEVVVPGRDRVGVFAAGLLPRVVVEATLVAGCAVGRVGVLDLLLDPLLDRLLAGLLVRGDAEGQAPVQAVGGGVAPVERVDVVALEGVGGLQLVLVVQAVAVAQVVL